MTNRNKRRDVYNLRELAKKVGFANPYHRLNNLFKDVDQFIDVGMIEETIQVLEQEHKKTIHQLKNKLKDYEKFD